MVGDRELKIIAETSRTRRMNLLASWSNPKQKKRSCFDRDRLQLPAGSAVLWNPQAPSPGFGTTAAGNNQ